MDFSSLSRFREWAEEKNAMAEVSFAVVPLAGIVDAPAVFAVRNAARLCDEVAVVNFSSSLDASVRELLRVAGASCVLQSWEDVPTPCSVYSAGGVDMTFFMQVLLSVMPQSVVLPENDPVMHRLLNGVLQTFPSLFSLHCGETPDALLSGAQRRLRACARVASDLFSGGEVRVSVLMDVVAAEAAAMGVVIDCAVVRQSDMADVPIGVVDQPCWMVLAIPSDAGIVRDVVPLVG